MATAEFWQRGETLDYTNSGNTKIAAGTIILFGSRIGVAGGDIPAGETGSLHVNGVFEMPKEYGDSGKALTAGQEVQWDNTNSYIKAAADSSPVHGYVVAAALTTDKTCLVKINA